MSELEKKLIVEALLSRLDEEDFLTNAKQKVLAMQTNSTIVPTIHPLPGSILTKITNATTILDDRDAFLQQAKAKTTAFKAARKDINNDLVSIWPPQIQEAVSGNVDLVQLLKYTARYISDSHGTSQASVTNSRPVITKIVSPLPHTHVIYMENDMTNDVNLPPDAVCCNLYETFDIANVTDRKKMIYLGRFKNGKFINHFPDDEEHTDVFYVAVYEAKSDENTPELSGAVKHGIE